MKLQEPLTPNEIASLNLHAEITTIGIMPSHHS